MPELWFILLVAFLPWYFHCPFQACPVCSEMVTKDMVNHITMQHGYLFKVFSHCAHVNSWYLSSTINAYICSWSIYKVLFPLKLIRLLNSCRIVAGCADSSFQAARPFLYWAEIYGKPICRCFLEADIDQATITAPQIFQLILFCHHSALASLHQMQSKHPNRLFPFLMMLRW